jgi:multisubunit Na+/H+ antiporter MnhB subunit
VGIADLFFVGLLVITVGAVVVMAAVLLRQQRKAREAGYRSLGAYLSAAPRTDQEKRDAADLALKGLVVCLLGLIFPPLLLVGLFPFFYGARKVVYAAMGLGLVDDGDDLQAGQQQRGA